MEAITDGTIFLFSSLILLFCFAGNLFIWMQAGTDQKNQKQELKQIKNNSLDLQQAINQTGIMNNLFVILDRFTEKVNKARNYILDSQKWLDTNKLATILDKDQQEMLNVILAKSRLLKNNYSHNDLLKSIISKSKLQIEQIMQKAKKQNSRLLMFASFTCVIMFMFVSFNNYHIFIANDDNIKTYMYLQDFACLLYVYLLESIANYKNKIKAETNSKLNDVMNQALSTKYNTIDDYCRMADENEVTPELIALNDIMTQKNLNALNRIVNANTSNSASWDEYQPQQILAVKTASIWQANQCLYRYLNGILIANSRDNAFYKGSMKDNHDYQQNMIDLLSLMLNAKGIKDDLITFNAEIRNERLIDTIISNLDSADSQDIQRFMQTVGSNLQQALLKVLATWLSISKKRQLNISRRLRMQTDIDKLDEESLLHRYSQMQHVANSDSGAREKMPNIAVTISDKDASKIFNKIHQKF